MIINDGKAHKLCIMWRGRRTLVPLYAVCNQSCWIGNL
jgi:hypothetical protein